MQNSDKQSIENSIAFRLFTEAAIIEQLSRNLMEKGLPDGLKLPQFSVLSHLGRRGGEWGPARLANAFQVTKGAMTNTLQRLESRALVTIRPNPYDKRGKLVRITNAGKEMYNQSVNSVGPVLDGLSQEIPERVIRSTVLALERIRKYLDSHRP